MSEKATSTTGTAPIAPAAPGTGIDLQVCPSCDSHLVQPVDWSHAGRERWRVELHCPDCLWNGGGLHEQDTVDRYDDFLDAAMQQVLDDLQLLTKANMEEGAERFLSALAANQILPEDF